MKLSEFLNQQGNTPQGKSVYQAFIDNFFNNKNIKWRFDCPDFLISTAFQWTDSPEGGDFWFIVHDKLQLKTQPLENDMLRLLDGKEPKEYPRWFKSTKSGLIVKFDGLQSGTVFYPSKDDEYEKGEYIDYWKSHTDSECWLEIENPEAGISDEEIKAAEELGAIKDGDTSYYDVGGIETIDIIEAKLSKQEYRGFLKGNCLKYLCRAGYKGQELSDYKKAADYLNMLIEEISNEM